MSAKTAQLQIRVTPEQKARLKALADHAGQGISSYVLNRALPDDSEKAARWIAALNDDAERSYALAALHDWLVDTSPDDFVATAAGMDVSGVDSLWQNYVAALVEQAATRKAVAVPAWVKQIQPLDKPWFAVQFASLRPHLIKSAPVPFKRRNIFVDTGLESRV